MDVQKREETGQGEGDWGGAQGAQVGMARRARWASAFSPLTIMIRFPCHTIIVDVVIIPVVVTMVIG